MFSAWSRHSVSITSAPSMPSSPASAPISLAKEIFTAWKALQAYLIISAVRSATIEGSTGSPE